MPNSISPNATPPSGSELFEIKIVPSDDAIHDFDGWLTIQKQRLAAAGFTVTAISGATFSGFYDPETADTSVLEQ